MKKAGSPVEPVPAEGPRVIAIIGSRGFKNTRLLAEVMARYKDSVVLIVSGGADGADKMGARWARKNGIETKIFEPDHKKYRHAYHHRNRLIVEAVDHVVAFWDGRSTGTDYTIGYARKMGRTVEVVKYLDPKKSIKASLAQGRECQAA